MAEPGDPQSLNRYAYASNNPATRIDPSGNWSFDIGLGLGTLSFSSGIGFAWDWGPSFGVGFSTGSYGNGLGLSASAGWGRGGFSADISTWAFGNYFGFGRSRGESYLATPFASFGGSLALADRQLRSELGLAGQLGIYSAARDDDALSKLEVKQSLGGYAEYDPNRGGAFFVDADASPLGFGLGRSVLGHEYWHSVDQASDSFLDSVYELEARNVGRVPGGSFTIWNSTFTRSQQRGIANTAQELRATEYEARTSGFRGFRTEPTISHYLQQYGGALDTIGIRRTVLRLSPKLP